MKKLLFLFSVFITLAPFLNAQGNGIFAHGEFGSTPDRKAKVTPYKTARKVGTGYVFGLMSGREEEVDTTRFKAAVRYPRWSSVDSKETLEKHFKKLNDFRKRFPNSGRYLDNRILLLKQAIDAKDKAKIVPKGKDFLGSFKTKAGKSYKHARLVKKHIDSIDITHAYGSGTIKYDQLPMSIRKKVGGFDEEAIRYHLLSPYQKAMVEHKKLLKQEKDEIRKLKQQISLHKMPMKPENSKHIKTISGEVLNVLPNGLLVWDGKKVVAVIEEQANYRVGNVFSADRVPTVKTYTYPTIKGTKHTCTVWKKPGLAHTKYLKKLAEYEKKMKHYNSRIKEIENKVSDRLSKMRGLKH